nr:MAG TPA: hypothetical protein [Caudoviricetes sp.]
MLQVLQQLPTQDFLIQLASNHSNILSCLHSIRIVQGFQKQHS